MPAALRSLTATRIKAASARPRQTTARHSIRRVYYLTGLVPWFIFPGSDGPP